MSKRKKIKLLPGLCAYCGKKIYIQKLWCSPACQHNWEKEYEGSYTRKRGMMG